MMPITYSVEISGEQARSGETADALTNRVCSTSPSLIYHVLPSSGSCPTEPGRENECIATNGFCCEPTEPPSGYECAESTETEMYLPPSLIEALLQHGLGDVDSQRVAGIRHLSLRGIPPAQWRISCTSTAPRRYHDPVRLVATA